MNVNFNLAASASHWANPTKKTETTGAIAENKNNDPIFKQQNAETAGAVAMFGGPESSGGHSFMAVA